MAVETASCQCVIFSDWQGPWRSLRGVVISTRGLTVWLTGLPAAGKTTVADEIAELLRAEDRASCRVDGDQLRRGMCADLGFDRYGRRENVRRAAHVAAMLADAGLVVVAALISPYSADRQLARDVHARLGLPFFEVYVDAPPEVCVDRDPKGLYSRALRGEVTGITGIDDPYERPANPELVVRTTDLSPQECAAQVIELLEHHDPSGTTLVPAITPGLLGG